MFYYGQTHIGIRIFAGRRAERFSSFWIEQNQTPVSLRFMFIGSEAKSPPPRAEPSDPAARFNPLEVEVLDLFVQISRLLGQPRSIAEIYGLLFISARPLAMDDLIERLELSKGSASQGLKFLRNMGAVKMVEVPGDRRIHYEAVAELRNLLVRFLDEQIVPQLEGGAARLERIARMAQELPAKDRARVSARVTMLQSWGKRGRRFLPMVVKIMGG